MNRNGRMSSVECAVHTFSFAENGAHSTPYTLALSAIVVLWTLTTSAGAAQVELFVTDYGENPTAEQRPLIDQPIVFAKPQEATIKTAEGKSV